MADCQLCGGSHPDTVPVCPKARTGQMLAEKYALGPLLGIGGIAAVYAAEHPILRRGIAVKILHSRFAKDSELSQRFVREARETAGLGHPAFVRDYDAGTTGDRPKVAVTASGTATSSRNDRNPRRDPR